MCTAAPHQSDGVTVGVGVSVSSGDLAAGQDRGVVVPAWRRNGVFRLWSGLGCCPRPTSPDRDGSLSFAVVARRRRRPRPRAGSTSVEALPRQAAHVPRRRLRPHLLSLPESVASPTQPARSRARLVASARRLAATVTAALLARGRRSVGDFTLKVFQDAFSIVTLWRVCLCRLFW